MPSQEARPAKPRFFGLFVRIVYVHQAFSLAVLGSGLASLQARGLGLHALSTAAGLVMVVATVGAMYGVAKRMSLSALLWLRLLLWAAVVRGALSALTLAAGSRDAVVADFVRSLLLNEATLLPLAIYWSRRVHGLYLAASPARSIRTEP